MKRNNHKHWCASMGEAVKGHVQKCDCDLRDRKVVARHDQSFYTAALSDGQVSLGDGNYRRMPLHSGD